MEKCMTCKFFEGFRYKDAKGECRIHAPRATLGEVDPAANYCNPEFACWPAVRVSDGCGDHQPMEEAK